MSSKIVEYNFISNNIGDLFIHEESFLDKLSDIKDAIKLETIYYMGLPYWLNGKKESDWYLNVKIYYA